MPGLCPLPQQLPGSLSLRVLAFCASRIWGAPPHGWLHKGMEIPSPSALLLPQRLPFIHGERGGGEGGRSGGGGESECTLFCSLHPIGIGSPFTTQSSGLSELGQSVPTAASVHRFPPQKNLNIAFAHLPLQTTVGHLLLPEVSPPSHCLPLTLSLSPCLLSLATIYLHDFSFLPGHQILRRRHSYSECLLRTNHVPGTS